mmetsp:Transcript_11919/g.21381  ORF Transcript_11919/g.21381 Transcript_11919/m.21381 type:complete len:101 (-) Transcript_11919:340-642(-)|eukprot:CAMPEP_0175072398 /NCGR_PEP_ID=MMETSP0052_2-20121109/19884_1 /TAXON_ID=51329 ORGANISM="Polytomella parva, Strain SAG 63-3" /NCGR_SAMPLE_ID=MMETSP0052_2 /ASSEMBLY_ACC=CAM_ASM_000194 /LENGTH=100 /DNA_ID=CAMNT_0016339891 /DNA_START=45 /DNA_END=347 /DNA_ORIENTATION=+
MSQKDTSLASLIDVTVSVITNDGRHYIGIMKGYDQATNIILQDCKERVYSIQSGVTINHNAGVMCLRGDSLAIIGELDEDLDAALDLDQIRASSMKPILH